MAFYGDLVLSKCAREEKVVLWRINGFESTARPPSVQDAPIATTAHEATRSAFGDGGYQRLLQFGVFDVEPFYIRFGLFLPPPGQHPILASGSTSGRIFLWDLEQLVRWLPEADLPFPLVSPDADPGRSKRGRRRKTESNDTISLSDASTGTGPITDPASSWRSSTRPGPMHDLSDPFQVIQAHQIVDLEKATFVTRKIAFSQSGEWMLVVGEHSTVAIFSRWNGDSTINRPKMNG